MTRPITNALSMLFLTIGAIGASADSLITNLDKVGLKIELYNKFYKIELIPHVVVEDIDSFTINIVKQILGQDAFEKDENAEEIVAQISSVIRKRLELTKDPRQVKDIELGPRNDLLFSINVTYLNRMTETQYYQYDFKQLKFYTDDSIDYAWQRFLHVNYQKYDHRRLSGLPRQNILRKMHRELMIDQSRRCGSSHQCRVNHCKKHVPSFSGYELKVSTERMRNIKKSRVLSAAIQHRIDDCIETGTYKGDTTLFLANSGACERVYTIELSKKFYEEAKQRFQNEIDNGNINAKKIVALYGNSGDVLRYFDDFKSMKGRNILYFLDGHYSYLDTARGKEDSPILRELDFIFDVHRKSNGVQVVLIDDAREFRGSRLREREGGGVTDQIIFYPELSYILDKLCESDPTAFVDLEDDLFMAVTNTQYHVI